MSSFFNSFRRRSSSSSPKSLPTSHLGAAKSRQIMNDNTRTYTNSSTFSSKPADTTCCFQPNINEMKQVFEKYDTNKDGRISRKEYNALLRAMGRGDHDEKQIVRTFEAADADNDGYIDFKEFMEVQKAEGGVQTSDIQNAFASFDLDGDGKISPKELMQVLKKMGENCNLESCKKMIRGVDRDGDGLIDMNDFTAMMTRTMKVNTN